MGVKEAGKRSQKIEKRSRTLRINGNWWWESAYETRERPEKGSALNEQNPDDEKQSKSP